MKRIFYAFLPFVLVLLLGTVSVLFNYTVIDVRLDDLDMLLRQAAKSQDENRSLGMLARYELIRRRMERGRENTVDYEMETRVQAVLTGGFSESQNLSTTRRWLKKPARFALNVIRLFMGKDIRKEEKDVSAEEKVIEVAYFWERNRHYDKAVEVYGNLLKNVRLSDEFRRYVLLHRAFCLSLVSKYDEAKADYEEVIRRYPESEAAVVAWKLIDFIEQIQQELTLVDEQTLSNFDKAKKLYLLMDYRGAIKLFSRFLETQAGASPAGLECRFLKGRSHEELGEIREALSEYRKILSLSPQSEWGREANRRIYILGEFYERDKEMTRTAIDRIKEYQDASFFTKLQSYSGMMEESDEDKKMRVALVTEDAKKGSGMSAKDIDRMLNGLDLTGEKRAQAEAARAQKEEAQETKTASALPQSIVLNKEETAEHAFRSRSSFSRVVEDNLPELKYLYQHTIRRGAVFEGRMQVRIVILPDGSVERAEIISSQLNNPPFEQQMLAKIKKWRFLKVPQDVGAKTFIYPFEFKKVE